MHFDFIIVGGGPIGLVCGIEAQKAGLNYLILEKGALVNALYHFPDNMIFFSTSILLEIGEVPFISHTEKPTRSEALEYYRRVVQSKGLSLRLYEEVLSVKKDMDLFHIQSSRQSYQAKKVVIATGFYDREVKLNVPGENLPKVKHYYNDPHPYFGQNLAVIGGGNSACDAALECWQKGAKVTMIIRDFNLKDSIKYWIKPNIENRIKEGSILVYFKTEVTEIQAKHLVIRHEGQLKQISNDFVLAMTGYQPDYEFLSKTGIRFQSDEYRTPVHDEITLESNISGLYLAGVIIGGLKTNKWFIENTRDHGKRILDHIMAHLL